jgi:hypothetical protein
MKALSLIALVFAAFLIVLGYTSKKNAGDVLGNTVIIGGVLIALAVAAIWTAYFIKEKRGK